MDQEISDLTQPKEPRRLSFRAVMLGFDRGGLITVPCLMRCPGVELRLACVWPELSRRSHSAGRQVIHTLYSSTSTDTTGISTDSTPSLKYSIILTIRRNTNEQVKFFSDKRSTGLSSTVIQCFYTHSVLKYSAYYSARLLTTVNAPFVRLMEHLVRFIKVVLKYFDKILQLQNVAVRLVCTTTINQTQLI